MSKPRHPHRGHLASTRIQYGLTAVVLLVALATTGCYQEPEAPRQFVPGNPLYDQFSSQGDRVVVDADDERLAIKIRRRRYTTRVFDADMIPVGQVGVDGDRIERRSRDGLDVAEARWVDDATAEVPGAWRIEHTAQGWDVFDADATVVALLRLRDDQWTLRPTRGDIVTFVVDADPSAARIVDADGDPILTIDGGDLSKPALLILAIDELPPLDRYSLAMWADRHLDSPPSP